MQRNLIVIYVFLGTLALFFTLHVTYDHSTKLPLPTKFQQEAITLPPGYKILTDGTNYKWEDETGFKSVFDYNTHDEAVERAWSFHKYELHRKANPWREVKTNRR